MPPHMIWQTRLKDKAIRCGVYVYVKYSLLLFAIGNTVKEALVAREKALTELYS